MKIKLNHVFASLVLLALSILNSPFSTAHAQGTAFTYQGRLNSNSVPLNGLYDFAFTLSNAPSGGSRIGSAITNMGVGVTNGLFAVTLDFGEVFTGNDTWLAIAVRSNGVGSFVGMTPLQELTPTPYAIFATTASNVSGTLPATQITGTLPLAQLPPGLVTNDEGGVTLSNLTLQGLLTLPLPANIFAGGNSLFIAPQNNNFYAGPSAGISNGTGGANTGLGAGSLNSNTNGTNNTAVGYQSLNNNTNGSDNVAVGERALFQNLSGNNNTAEGRHALQNNPGGNDNTANGFQALLANTGSNNTAAGSGALSGLVSGSYNIAVGFQSGANYTGSASSNILIGNQGVSGDNLTIRIGDVQTTTYIAGVINGNGGGLTNLTGSQITGTIALAQLPPGVVTNDEGGVTLSNVTVGGDLNLASPAIVNSGGTSILYSDGQDNFFAGIDAGNVPLSGYYNTAIGVQALTSITSGTYNTASGYEALQSNTTGEINTGTGVQALWKNTTGIFNTADGVDALYPNTTGSYNTALGVNALAGSTNGSNNIGIGFGAGQSLTGNSNIDIGSYGAATDNNVIRIGEGQSATYTSGTVCVDGSTTNNGLLYMSNGLPGISDGSGPFLFGYNGGALGGLAPTTVAMSWDYAGNVWVNQNASLGTLTIRGGSDLAEPFKITSDKNELPDGSVVVIDKENPGHLKVSSQPYDKRVAGILSGANGINPGIQMQQQGLLEGDRNVALTGRVYVQADASNGAIEPGDQLTTSSTPGRAMKVTDYGRAQGAILGKAMTGLSEGNGMVLVLVTLQ